MYHEVLDFWFDEISEEQRFQKDLHFDNMIAEKFGALHDKASRGELYSWRDNHLGRLAEIIILDQFSRNIYRDKPQAFASDPMALTLAQEAVSNGIDTHLSMSKKMFLYMPYMHSESVEIHHVALELYEKLGIENAFEYEKKHYEIIKEFGRYPHRNEILGRISTQDELEFLSRPGSSF